MRRKTAAMKYPSLSKQTPNSHRFRTYPQLNHSYPQVVPQKQSLFLFKRNTVKGFRFVEKRKHAQFV